MTAGNFNLTDYKNNNYLQGLYNPGELYAAAKANMEQTDIEKAREATKTKSFGSLTLSEKLLTLGVGKKVFEQIGDTALGVVRSTIDPITNFLKDYEKVYTGALDQELQSYAKQMFFASTAMSEEDQTKTMGRNFVYQM